MPTVAYLANLFPSSVEPYVAEEIRKLRTRKIKVIPCSARRAGVVPDDVQSLARETVCLQPLRLKPLVQAIWWCVREFRLLREFLHRVAFQGTESRVRRWRALLHTLLGAYFAVLVKDRGVQHIHVHHGYFGSWIAMVAARLLGIPFSMTLHGSDLLLHAAYLDLKLKHCRFCVTVSEFNRQHVLRCYTGIDAGKIIVHRMGVDCAVIHPVLPPALQKPVLVMLAVGRLHPVKDHRFLIGACRLLKSRGTRFECLIAGEGEERGSLEGLIDELRLGSDVRLLGHLSNAELDLHYRSADLVVLTSRSEGIPLALMEAMVRGKPVLAPAITGIPELVFDGKNGFLYRPGSIDDFVARVELIWSLRAGLGPLCQAARQQVRDSFDREKNLQAFCDGLISYLAVPEIPAPAQP